jgi:hypothetical protein
MLGRGVGLVQLVERAREQALAGDAVARWYREAHDFQRGAARRCQEAAYAVADEVCKLALGGQFRWGCNVAFPYDLYVPMELWDDLALIDECPAWLAFNDAIVLAERIDSYLGVLEGDRRTAVLAQDCRGELDLLLVLADLCEDAGLPRAAAEARHLHELARRTSGFAA